MAPFGSVGDVLPFLGIGRGLRDRGHRVSVVASEYFRGHVEKAGLDLIAVSSSREYLDSIERFAATPPDDQAWCNQELALYAQRSQFEAVADLRQQVVGPTGVVASYFARGAFNAAERFKMPLVTVLTTVQATRYLSGGKTPGDITARAKWVQKVTPIIRETNAFRAEVGLPPVGRPFMPKWFSPRAIVGLFPTWFEPRHEEWPDHLFQTGFLLDDNRVGQAIPPAIKSFVEAGEPPIVVSAASWLTDTRAYIAVTQNSCRRLSRRVVILSPAGRTLPDDLPESVFLTDFVPFSYLLPRSAAIVHSMGIGTIAQSLAAGIPQVGVPHLIEQADNAARVQCLGVSRTISPKDLTVDRLVATLQELLSSPEVRSRCVAVSQRFEGVDPIGDACAIIERACVT